MIQMQSSDCSDVLTYLQEEALRTRATQEATLEVTHAARRSSLRYAPAQASRGCERLGTL